MLYFTFWSTPASYHLSCTGLAPAPPLTVPTLRIISSGMGSSYQGNGAGNKSLQKEHRKSKKKIVMFGLSKNYFKSRREHL